MSLVLDDITPYFTSKIGSITGKKFTYLNKPFDQSIPSTVIDRGYSIIFERVSGVSRNMIDFHMVASIYVLLYIKGYQYEDKAREDAAKDSELIIKACMKVLNANTQPAIKNVSMRTIDIEPLPGNDNTIVSRINFDVSLRMNPNI
jgi:hypothetical protein